MKLGEASPKQRLMIFICFCWLAFAAAAAAQSYEFSWSTMFFLGLFPIVFIAGLAWTISGFRSEPSNLIDTNYERIKALGQLQGQRQSTTNIGKSTLNIRTAITSTLKFLGLLIGITVGNIFGKEFGVYFIFPALGFLGAFALIKYLKLNERFGPHIQNAICILSAHTTWLVAAGLFGASFNQLWLDCTLMILGLAALVGRPHVRNIHVTLAALQGLAIMTNLNALISSEVSIPALYIHLGLRISFIAFLFLSWTNKLPGRSEVDKKAA